VCFMRSLLHAAWWLCPEVVARESDAKAETLMPQQ